MSKSQKQTKPNILASPYAHSSAKSKSNKSPDAVCDPEWFLAGGILILFKKSQWQRMK